MEGLSSATTGKSNLSGSPLGLALHSMGKKMNATATPDGKAEKNPTECVNRAITDLQDIADKVPEVKDIIEDMQNLVKSLKGGHEEPDEDTESEY